MPGTACAQAKPSQAKLRCRVPPASHAQRVPFTRPPSLAPQELLGPGNQENLTLAAEDAGKSVPVHIYLYNHYADPWGYNFTTSAELQARAGGGGGVI